MDIWELTVPFENNIKARNKDKSDKYAHLITDIKTHKTSVNAFEVGSRGHLSKDNLDRLKTSFCKYCDKSSKQKKFLENISAITINSSYLIYNNRKEPSWTDLGHFKPIF